MIPALSWKQNRVVSSIFQASPLPATVQESKKKWPFIEVQDQKSYGRNQVKLLESFWRTKTRCTTADTLLDKTEIRKSKRSIYCSCTKGFRKACEWKGSRRKWIKRKTGVRRWEYEDMKGQNQKRQRHKMRYWLVKVVKGVRKSVKYTKSKSAANGSIGLLLNSEGEKITADKAWAEMLNGYFPSIFTKKHNNNDSILVSEQSKELGI